ncbi:MAG: chorismate synthase [Candidatus Izemoplasmatales bacterium]
MNTIGNNIKITFFGESHGEYIGVVIDQLKPGILIDFDLIDFNLSKRRPKSNISTPRQEEDKYKVISGINEGYTTGAALTFLIPNENTKSKDYKNLLEIPRPSHADYPAFIKYNGYNEKAGGGIFSGRVTALWIIVGSICQQILENNNVYVCSHINSIYNICDRSFKNDKIDIETIKDINKEDFPVIDKNKKNEMIDLISSISKDLDSLGGTIESSIINLPVGIGEPLFLSVESYLSSLLFSIPGIKGIEFGDGFNLAKMKGSEANDPYEINNGKINILSNHNGGILGGISTGNPIILKLSVKPTSSIGLKQRSINLKTNENVELEIIGRHDPQIVSRIVHVVNAVLNFAIMDLYLFVNKDLKI